MTGSPKNKFDTIINLFFLDGDCTDKLKNGLEVVHRWVEWKLFQIPLTAALKWNATLCYVSSWSGGRPPDLGSWSM